MKRGFLGYGEEGLDVVFRGIFHQPYFFALLVEGRNLWYK